MLSKKIAFDHSITEMGHIQVRQITRIMENGEMVSQSYHRHVVNPGESIEGQDERTVILAKAIHTPEVRKAYSAAILEDKTDVGISS